MLVPPRTSCFISDSSLDIFKNYGSSSRHFMSVLAGKKLNYCSTCHERRLKTPTLKYGCCDSIYVWLLKTWEMIYFDNSE
jgi:hypothetical protein